MFCNQCGFNNVDGAKFCNSCGATMPVSNTQQSAQMQPQSTVQTSFQGNQQLQQSSSTVDFKQFIKQPDNQKICKSIKNYAGCIYGIAVFFILSAGYFISEGMKGGLDTNQLSGMGLGSITMIIAIALTIIASTKKTKICEYISYVVFVLMLIGLVDKMWGILGMLLFGNIMTVIVMVLRIAGVIIPILMGTNISKLNKKYKEYMQK